MLVSDRRSQDQKLSVTAAGQNSASACIISEESGDSLSIGEVKQFYLSMREELIRFLTRRTGDFSLAADLTHDIFEKLPRVRAHIPSKQKARAYLYRMASNLALDYTRSEARRAELAQSAFAVECAGEPSAEQVAMAQDELRVLDEALDELPVQVKDVLLLIRIEGLKHKEVAARLGISVSLVEKHQVRALEHCRKRLGVLPAPVKQAPPPR